MCRGVCNACFAGVYIIYVWRMLYSSMCECYTVTAGYVYVSGIFAPWEMLKTRVEFVLSCAIVASWEILFECWDSWEPSDLVSCKDILYEILYLVSCNEILCEIFYLVTCNKILCEIFYLVSCNVILYLASCAYCISRMLRNVENKSGIWGETAGSLQI